MGHTLLLITVECITISSDVTYSIICNGETIWCILWHQFKLKNFSRELKYPTILSPCLNIKGNKYNLVRNKKVMCNRSSFWEGYPPISSWWLLYWVWGVGGEVDDVSTLIFASSSLGRSKFRSISGREFSTQGSFLGFKLVALLSVEEPGQPPEMPKISLSDG